MMRKALCIVSLLFLVQCTYDASPPDESEKNDGKPLLMIDATGFSPQRAVQLQYTDALGVPKTVATSAEKTDASGRFLYPLYMARGTRTFSVTVTVDQDGSGTFGTIANDRQYQLTSSFNSDNETRNLVLTNTTNFSNF